MNEQAAGVWLITIRNSDTQAIEQVYPVRDRDAGFDWLESREWPEGDCDLSEACAQDDLGVVVLGEDSGSSCDYHLEFVEFAQ